MPKEDNLSKPKPVQSLLWGREIKVPNVVKEMLLDDEKVLHAIQQSRLEHAITPYSVFVTNKRIIKHMPRTLGLRRDVVDYKYVDMSNTTINQGFISSSIKINVRFLSKPFVLERIPTKVCRQIFKTIQDGIDGRLDNSSETKIFPKQMVETSSKSKIVDDGPLTILQKRYAQGKITTDQFKEMRRNLVAGKR